MSESQPPAEAKAPSVYDHLAHVLDLLAQVSWSKLGLQHDILTGKLEPNLAEAKVAIDMVAHIVSVLEPQLDEADRRQVQSIVRDLRMNFVQQNKEVGG